MKTYITNQVVRMLLLENKTANFCDKITYLLQIIANFAPIAFVLEGLNFWFISNRQFFGFVVICLIVNVVVGAWYHKRKGTFNWESFYKRNLTMWVILILVYLVLEMMRLTVPKSIVTDYFGALIQLTTLLYPISKILKNIYFLSGEKHPPKFIMDRLYNFEQDGNLKKLFDEESNSDSTKTLFFRTKRRKM